MPRDGSGVYTKPANTTASPNTTIESTKYNTAIDDLVADANTDRPIVAGGTGASDATTALANLGGSPQPGYVSKSGAYTVVAGDKGKLIDCTAALTLTLTAAATLGAGFAFYAKANGGDITIDPNGSETINGSSTLVVAGGTSALIVCDGSNWYTAQVTAGSASAGHIFGLELSNGTDTDHDIDITTGSCASDDSTPYLMRLASALTKRLDAPWAVGTGNGGLDTGSIAADTWYHKWIIERSDTRVADALFSASATSPTMPTNYDRKRRIGSVLTDGSANIIGFTQSGDDFRWLNPPSDVNASSMGTSGVLRTVSTPLGVKTIAILGAGTSAVSQDARGRIMSPDTTDVATDGSNANIGTSFGSVTGQSWSEYRIRTNTSSQIRSRFIFSSSTIFLFVNTIGWVDPRGRLS